ncbi:P2X purinoceptor 6 isoform X1 [Rana temporaria]|uniref:P2X purinoceptor 6 isoform X1 n=1 Tax=Rana temporaria TaxID=8407 RepID=UPI001AACCB69|nr:P2X purinoceptor 6 isoform X1 [Rana temporaria]
MEAACIKSFPPILDYKTEKYVLTKNRKVGAFHRLLHLGILCYIIGWVFIVKKGYQESDSDPHSSVITKLKGSSVTKDLQEYQQRLWDVGDFVKPSQGENVLFLVTNFIATPRQVLGLCPESPLIVDGRCGEDLDCTPGEHVVNGNGLKTGRCISLNSTHSTCEIYSWCPVENESLIRKIPLNEAENFTLFIKNSVYFSKFRFSGANTLKTLDDTYFKSCRYDPVSSPYCPVFTIKNIITKTKNSFEELSLLGGVVRIDIEWKCNLDQAQVCIPQYSFGLQDKNNNFRTATYYWDKERRETRDLLKLYGIRFEISVTGEARRFSIVPTAVSLGTGCAFLGSATLLCDLILLYLDSKASFYWECKYEEAKPPKGQQAEQPTINNDETSTNND